MGNMSKGQDATDYSKVASWYTIPEITKGIDTFFVYPTEYLGLEEGDPAYATLDNPGMREGVEFDHLVLASVYEDSTNVFMPYYRQASAKTLGDAWKDTGDIRTALASIPYADVTAALDYYFDNYNGGRPFIIAGHSQGSAIVTLVLKDYFREHPEYYRRMVAAYVIGFSVTRDYLEANPHLRFAAGEREPRVANIRRGDVRDPDRGHRRRCGAGPRARGNPIQRGFRADRAAAVLRSAELPQRGLHLLLQQHQGECGEAHRDLPRRPRYQMSEMPR